MKNVLPLLRLLSIAGRSSYERERRQGERVGLHIWHSFMPNIFAEGPTDPEGGGGGQMEVE